MSNSFTPYDKQSYKESKRRRRQAEIADKTGRILPLDFARRKMIILIVIFIAVLIVAGIAALLFFTLGSASDNNTSEADNSSESLLTVVNSASPLSQTYVPELAQCGGFEVNSAAADSLLQMYKDAESQGVDLKIKSTYISYDEQNRLYEKALEKYLSNPDYTRVRAEAAAQKEVPPAGCSEAQTGLLIDFEFGDRQSKSFLERSCVNYGFILRYPSDKTALTWHNGSDTIYRYTGKENAVKMRAYDMCLEEYNNYLAVQGGSK